MRSLAALLCSLLGLAACSRDAGPSDEPSIAANSSSTARPRVESPDTLLRRVDHLTHPFTESLFRDVYPEVFGARGVCFEWRQVERLRTVGSTRESFVTDYAVDRIAVPDAWTVCVFGRRDDRSTVLEQWNFEALSADGEPAPCWLGRGEWRLPKRTNVTNLWSETPDGPRGRVRDWRPTLSEPTRLLVFFDRSRELVLFDLAGGPERVVADLGRAPQLTSQHAHLAGRSTDRGDTYWVLAGCGSTKSHDAFLLLDADRDGVPEETRWLTPSEWQTSEWASTCPNCMPEE